MKRWIDYLTLLVIVLLAHGLLLLSDGVFWDDWLWYTSLSRGDHFLVYRAALQRGLPSDYYFWLSFTLFPDVVVGQRVIVFALIVASALVTYWICRTTGALSRFECVVVAAMAATYPAFQCWLLIATSQYVFYYFLFLCGILASLRAGGLAGWKAALLRIVSLLLFFLAFALNSLLVLYGGFLLLLLRMSYRPGQEAWGRRIVRFAVRHVDYLLLPIAYWIIKHIFFPQFGLYADYNRLSLSLYGKPTLLATFLKNAVYYQIGAAIQFVFSRPAMWIPAVLVLALGAWLMRGRSLRVFQGSVRPCAVLVFGVVLLGLSMFPYVAVGLAPSTHGWDTRHALLVAAPMGLILLAVLRLTFRGRRGSLPPLGWASLVILLLGFISLDIAQYVGWQQRWIKDRSVMVQLKDSQEARQYSVIWVDDQLPSIGGEIYQFYEWSSMFAQTWGAEKWVGLPRNVYGDWFITEGYLERFRSYNYEDIDPLGCQATLTIRPGEVPLASAATVMEYYYYRFLRPSGMNSFLDSVTRIGIAPYPSPLAAHCQTTAPRQAPAPAYQGGTP